MSLTEQFNLFADRYVNERLNHFNRFGNPVGAFFETYVSGATTLLDVGCGGGEDLLHYRRLGVDRVFGVEPARKMLELAKSATQDEATILEGNWENLPFSEQTFDVIAGNFSLHYISCLDPAYLEAHRVLKPGGRLIVVASHPTYDSFDTSTKIHSAGRPIIERALFNGSIHVHYYQHHLRDYFSRKFLSLFKTIDLAEFYLESNRSFPTALGFVGVK